MSGVGLQWESAWSSKMSSAGDWHIELLCSCRIEWLQLAIVPVPSTAIENAAYTYELNYSTEST
jgi:hypothetical protein